MEYEYLKSRYKAGEPIFLSDINIAGMTEENLRYYMKKYVDNGLIKRFDSGVYYIPVETLTGEKSVISSETVAFNKYICREGKRVGFYSGYTLANKMGLTTQVPFVEEIISNYSPAIVREVNIKNRKYVVRKPVIEITENNIYVLELLECLKDIDKTAEVDMKKCGEILKKYITKHHITKKTINQYLNYYPVRIYKAIYETGVESSLEH